jgi:hypothetical protein
MPKELTLHRLDAAEPLRVIAADEPGFGGAHHAYVVDWPTEPPPGRAGITIKFQNGPVPDKGHNGLTIEALIAICIDRLECFQAGPYPNQFNAAAEKHLRHALSELHQRTWERKKRGVEGKLQA